jgi:hypothetical protein
MAFFVNRELPRPFASLFSPLFQFIFIPQRFQQVFSVFGRFAKSPRKINVLKLLNIFSGQFLKQGTFRESIFLDPLKTARTRPEPLTRRKKSARKLKEKLSS